MIWTIYSDDTLLYDPRLAEHGYMLTAATLSEELNTTGSLSFTLPQTNPAYNVPQKLSSIITVYRDGALYWRGRVINESVDFYKNRTIKCEGELAYLIDSIQRPFAFPAAEGDTATPEAYLTYLIGRHNAQVPSSHQFTVGTVTVTDANNYISRSDTEYSSTWSLIKEGLIDILGGYIVTRHENGVNYIDYLADFDTLANQPIKLGENLLDLTQGKNGEEIATAILPLGAKSQDSDVRLTISTLTDETVGDVVKSGDIVYNTAAETLYGGRIAKVVTWDDVTVASNLLTKAKAALSAAIQQADTVELSAADLSAAGYDCSGWSVGTYVSADSAAHGIDANYMILKLETDLLNPASNKLTVGSEIRSFVSSVQKQQAAAIKIVESNAQHNTNKAVQELEQRTVSNIQQSSNQIMSQVADQYYTKGDTDQKISSVSTQVTQNAEQVEIKFNQFQQAAADAQAGNDAKFTDISRYIRFVDGNIILGEDGNQLTLKIENDRISFRGANDLELAHFSNNSFEITNLSKFRVGSLAMVVQPNGSVSFVGGDST